MSTLHFMRPFWLLALLPLMGILWYAWRHRLTSSNWQQICDPALYAAQVTGVREGERLWPWIALFLAWLLAVVALAGPAWRQVPSHLYRPEQANVVLLDASRDMDATDILPSRMVRGKYKVLDILKGLHDRQVAMLAFAKEPYVVSPLTDDSRTIAALVPEITSDIMPVQGFQLDKALDKAVQLLKGAGQAQGNVILMTGGQVRDKDVHAASALSAAGYKLYVIGLGTKGGAPIKDKQGNFLRDETGAPYIVKTDAARLSSLAQVGHGAYIPFDEGDADVEKLLKVLTPNSDKAAYRDQTQLRWADEGRLLCFPLLFLALLVFRKAWLEEVA